MANSEDVLERARNSILLVNEANQSLHIHNQQMFGLVCDLAAEVRELRRDRARLDWLADCGSVLMWQDRDQEYLVVDAATRAVVARAKTSRAAIDAARLAARG